MFASLTNNTTTGEDSLAISQWINWCRLCAKEDDSKHNINFLYQNEEQLEYENKKLSIQEALAKYFWVKTSVEDALPKMLCPDCLTLVSSLITFNERVERVQLMFLHLNGCQSIVNGSCDLTSIRQKYDVMEEERNHWFSKYFITKDHFEDSKCHVLETQNNDKQQLQVQIKLENGEKSPCTDQEDFIDEDTDLDKEEVLCEDNLEDDSYKEDEEDPFSPHKDQQEDMLDNLSSNSEDFKPTKTLQTDEDSLISKPDRNKKRKKRKKLKHCFSKENKTKKKKINIKDFKMEITCKDCEQQFTKYITYREHLQNKHEHKMHDKHWPCPSCDKVLLSLYNLERHVRIHIPLEVRQTIKCPECDNRYTTNAQLETHVRYKHKNEKPFICEECGLCLRTNSNLRQHMLIHTDIAPYECEVCKKKFKNKTRLKTHMDIHSPNKHICNICGLQLNSRATLNRHFLVHSDEMQHKCDYCGKAFKRAKALKNHLLLHTGLKPYSCDFCDRTFANGSNCRSHMKKMHPDELAVLEASGNKTHTKNIPKLETLKAVTKAADNLTPVVTKFSGCFAFGKKPKILECTNTKAQKSPPKLKKSYGNNQQLCLEKLSVAASPSSTPLDLQYTPLAGNLGTTANSASSCLTTNTTKCMESDLTATPCLNNATTTAIPNFDNIYQHLMKQNHTEQHNKRNLTQISPSTTSSTPQHQAFYALSGQNNILDQQEALSKVDQLNSPESHHSTMTPLTHDDHSNASSLQGSSFYGPLRPTLPPGNFM